MRVMLFVCMLRECEGNVNAGVGDGGGVVVVSVGHVDGTFGSGIVSSTTYRLGMSVVRGMGGVGGVCEMCMCLAQGGIGGEGGERIWFRFYQCYGNRGSVGHVSVFLLQWCRWVGGLEQGLEEWGSVMSV